MHAGGHHGQGAQRAGIARIAGWTRATGPVANGDALGVEAARVRIRARIGALLVDARHFGWTTVVVAASRHAGTVLAYLTRMALAVLGTLVQRYLLNGLAVIVRIAIVVDQTPTMGSMKDGLTLGIEAARCLHRARIDALAVEARPIECTIGIASAARHALALVTDLTGRASIVVVTLLEQIDTVVGLARLPRATLIVAGALEHFQILLVLLAQNIGIAIEVGCTLTLGTMVDLLAQCMNATATGQRARVHTLAVMARLVERTIVIRAAAHQASIGDAHLRLATIGILVTLFLLHVASVHGIAVESLWTAAHSIVIDGHTNGIDSTTLDGARILAQLIDAGHLEAAIAVTSTPVRAAASLAYFRGATLVVR